MEGDVFYASRLCRGLRHSSPCWALRGVLTSCRMVFWAKVLDFFIPAGRDLVALPLFGSVSLLVPGLS